MITLVTISDGDKHFESAIHEYVKRLWRWLIVHSIKPSKKSSPVECIHYDTKSIVEYIIHKHTQSVVIILSKKWIQRSTESRSDFIRESLHQSHNLLFIIGGPYGLDESLLRPYTHKQLSLWKITMPHGLAKLVTLEQLYRCQQIREGRSYHY